jgi:L-proline amide hydrolase
LPADIRDALNRHEEAGTVTDPEYLAATDEFYKLHLCRVVPMPQDLVDTIEQMEAEPTVYHTMNGPNEFHVLGTLKGWSIIDRLPQITAPALVIAGEYDEATPEAWQPYADQIPDAESHVFGDTSHCSHLEKPEEVRGVVAAFLARHDATARV